MSRARMAAVIEGALRDAGGTMLKSELLTVMICHGAYGDSFSYVLDVMSHKGLIILKIVPGSNGKIVVSLPEAVSAPCSVAKGSTLPETAEQSREVALPQSQDEAQSD